MNYEQLAEGVTIATENANPSALVRGALRGGVDKLEFVFAPEWGVTQGWSKTLEWTDRYYVDGAVQQQQVKRTQRVPDIVISAADLGPQRDTVNPLLFTRNIQFRNWSDPFRSKPGPGTLQGPVTITFAKLGHAILNTFPAATTEATGINFALPGLI